MALPLFFITLFVSAFLLFLVQPMIGKMILPKLGGTPQVWNTCMVFFQTVLLLGYFYTHTSTTYLKPRVQMILHGLLLFVPLVLLLGVGERPFDVRDWDPPSGTNPIWETLKLLAIVVGIPFFVVATSAPLLQKWFSFSGHHTAPDPYYLYAASNLGSLLSLVAYPFVVEPQAFVQTQAWIWTWGYAALVAMILASACLVWRSATSLQLEAESPADPRPDPLPAVTPTPAPETKIQPARGKKKGLRPTVSPAAVAPAPDIAARGYNPQTAPVTWTRGLRWVLLAAVPSSLMLGVTSYVSTDLSPFPLLWVIPLAFYLLSFILVFSKWPLPWTEGPHTIMLYSMVVAIAGLCLVIFSRDYAPTWPLWISFIGFFLITMALHGELAKDRPAPRHLTLFFLLMSVGGMLGGLFNGIFAPLWFTGVAEYPIAIFAACLLRPNLTDYGWLDGMLLQNPNARESARAASDSFAQSMGKKPVGEPFLMAYAIDILVGLAIVFLAFLTVAFGSRVYGWISGFLAFAGMSDNSLESWSSQLFQFSRYGLPMIACLVVSPRSLRFALGIGGLLFLAAAYGTREGLIYADRSYFGVLKVSTEDERLYRRLNDGRTIPWFSEVEDLPKHTEVVPYNFLMHGSTYHGRNYQTPELSRLATTYYHRFGPVGVIMEKYNWFPARQNTFQADLRMPVSMIGMGASAALSGLPLDMLDNVWTDPPYATIGLGTGTMASYTRWLQHMTYYEIDDKIRDMSLPPAGKEPFFKYVKEAGDRGGFVEIVMGDARLSLEKEAKREKERLAVAKPTGPTAMRDGYYNGIVVDAFSSDAIPVHLITKEAIKLYMDKLTPDGVLMVHTSNRHLALTKPVADIAKDLGLDAFIGNDRGDNRDRGVAIEKNRIYSMGHFGSEYIMLARKNVLDLDKLKAPFKGYPTTQKTNVIQWRKAQPRNMPIWTDHYQDIVSILRHGTSREDE